MYFYFLIVSVTVSEMMLICRAVFSDFLCASMATGLVFIVRRSIDEGCHCLQLQVFMASPKAAPAPADIQARLHP